MKKCINAAPIKDDKDNITGVVLIFRDITEHKKVIEARKKQIEQEQLIAQL
ncbi:PAS domain-containing protein [Dendronalium phyllosphericum]|uniref:PAS domain-containing protein n=1 Tax=Dendronalium phyllosphericum TaxID=2840445 RepID=UPI001CEC9B31|nr:PAS domain-containing protein [Dendronalium phyllosphericum]